MTNNTPRRLVRLVAVVLALLTMTLMAACGNEPAPEPISRADIAQIARAEAELATQAAISAMPMPAPGISREEAEQIVQSAISSMPEPQREPGLTRAEAERIVEAAVSALEIPTARLTAAEIEQIAQYAMENTSMPEPGITREEAETSSAGCFLIACRRPNPDLRLRMLNER